jgi:hypothetical protein
MTGSWLPIEYRDFYDVPRMIVVERRGQLYLFDAPFDDAADDYADHYAVYRLPESAREEVGSNSWVGLAAAGQRVGDVAVSEVELDETKRRLINDNVFSRWEVDLS